MEVQIVDLIENRLASERDSLRESFLKSASGPIKTRHVAIDNLLPASLASEIAQNFPHPQQMRLLKSFREKKYATKDFDQVNPILKEVSFAFQSPRVLKVIEDITGIQEQRPDPTFYAGGLSCMGKGDFLNPHIDNSHDGNINYYRTLNLLYYVSPDWSEDWGGNLELWDQAVREKITIPSLFNRLVLMETHKTSWHSVSPVLVDNNRYCVSNYYFSEKNPNKEEYTFHVTSFSARPEQKMKRVLSEMDGTSRNLLRKIFKWGLGKKDIYDKRTR